MTRFYKIDSNQLDNMPVDEFQVYWEQITKLEAQEMLIQMTIADYPALKGHQRTNLYNKVKSHASDESKKLFSTKDIAAALGAING
tara:strand:+ start:4908 stop:5165 length:258 start_codon:yes stop_codon:yes gene_type:complete